MNIAYYTNILQIKSQSTLTAIILLFSCVVVGLLITITPILVGALLVIVLYCLIFWYNPRWVLLFLGIVLVFQGVAIRHSGAIGTILKMHDKVFLSLSFLLLITKRFADGTLKFKPIGFLFLGLSAIGLASSLAHNLTGAFAAVAGYGLMMKGFLIFFIFLNAKFTESEIKSFFKAFYFVAVIIVITTLINVAFPGPFNKFVGAEALFYRANMLSAVSVFGHPGGLGTTMGIFACFTAAYYIVTGEKSILVLTAIFLMTMLLSLRITPAVGFYGALVFAAFILRSTERHRATFFLIAIGGMFLFVFADIVIDILSGALKGYITHANYDKVARDALYINGFKIARDYFPLGAGFGTYGGYISYLIYSPLYYKYGLYKMWGLSPQTGQFISDTFWPHIMGEIGFIGLIIYVAIIFVLITFTVKAVKTFESTFLRTFALGTAMTFVLSLAHSIKGVIYEQSLWAYLIFGSAGMICSQLLNAEEKKLIH